MTYEQAIAAVKAGTNVKRSSWNGRYLHKRTGVDTTIIDDTWVRTTRAPYAATQEDITADDWTTA